MPYMHSESAQFHELAVRLFSAPGLEESLASRARELAGGRGSAVVRLSEDPSAAIVAAAEEQRADVLVVGNAGMQGRKEFLLFERFAVCAEKVAKPGHMLF